MTDTTPTPAPPVLKTFSDFGVDDRVCAALADKGIVNPFPIQELTLPLALTGADLIGQARTGTGKTLAFGIPLVQRAIGIEATTPSALVIVPTRELCLQVRDDLAAASAQTDVEVLAVYGGKAIDVQIDALRAGVDIVVGTPGRLLDLLQRGDLTLRDVTGLVLDEADEMLDLGFLPDVEQLIQATAAQRQTLLFSATMPSAVVALARRYMDKPTFMRADVEEVRIGPDTKQHFLSCHRMDKPAVLARILQAPGRGLCVVFSRTKRMADVLVEDLRGQGVNAAAIHSDLRQDARERALRSFRTGKTDVLVATEVAARGLDITDVTHVVNYDCPDDEKMYLHRIGRTGRAGAAGVAVTLAVWNELARLEMIKKALGITEPTHEVFSTSPILQELFDLPPQEKPKRAAPAKRATPTATSDDTADASGEESGARKRSRRSRGGRRTPAARRPATDPVVDDAVTPEAAEAKDAKHAAPDDSVAPAAPAATDPASGQGDQAADGDVVRRVRTRRRSSGGGSAKPAAAAPTRSDRPSADADADADDQAGARPARTRGDGPARPDRKQSNRGNDRRARSDGRSRSDSRSRGDSGRGQGSNRSQSPRSTAVDASAARGGGRPRLARPLEISFLP